MVAEPRDAPSCWGWPMPGAAASPAPPLWASALGGPPFLHHTPSLASSLSVLPLLGARQGGNGSSSIPVWEPLLFKFKALPLRADHQLHLDSFLPGAGRAGQGRSMVTSLASLGSLSLPPLACTAPGSLADSSVSYLGCLLAGHLCWASRSPSLAQEPSGQVTGPLPCWGLECGTFMCRRPAGAPLGSAGRPCLSWPLP